MRQFYWTRKAWYAHTIKSKEILFGYYGDDMFGEMTMTWEDLGENTLIPQLHIFNDAWKILYTFQDLLQKLAEVDGENITEEEFVEILKECGFKDATPYEDPYENNSLTKEKEELQNRIDEINKQLGIK